jgi:hypothetical protein
LRIAPRASRHTTSERQSARCGGWADAMLDPRACIVAGDSSLKLLCSSRPLSSSRHRKTEPRQHFTRRPPFTLPTRPALVWTMHCRCRGRVKASTIRGLMQHLLLAVCLKGTFISCTVAARVRGRFPRLTVLLYLDRLRLFSPHRRGRLPPNSSSDSVTLRLRAETPHHSQHGILVVCYG